MYIFESIISYQYEPFEKTLVYNYKLPVYNYKLPVISRNKYLFFGFVQEPFYLEIINFVCFLCEQFLVIVFA